MIKKKKKKKTCTQGATIGRRAVLFEESVNATKEEETMKMHLVGQERFAGTVADYIKSINQQLTKLLWEKKFCST